MIRCFALAMVAACPGTGLVFAQEPEPPQPTKHHEVLFKEVGTWKASGTMTMPMEMDASATEVNEKVCNGLWVRTSYSGVIGGMKIEGHGLVGYDLAKNKYVGYWVDNFGSSPSHMEGSWDAENNTMTYYITGVDPQTNKEVKQKQVVTFHSKDEKSFKLYMAVPDQDEMALVLEMKAKRTAPEKGSGTRGSEEK